MYDDVEARKAFFNCDNPKGHELQESEQEGVLR